MKDGDWLSGRSGLAGHTSIRELASGLPRNICQSAGGNKDGLWTTAKQAYILGNENCIHAKFVNIVAKTE
jgi:hypothetical protein